MADNIIKLKVDSQEYEGKIKRASQGLQELGRNLREAGKTFADADAKQVEFARELGKMQTVSNTAKGKIAEMSAAFVNLKSQYLQMTEEEKRSPIGLAMSHSLEELKLRTIDAKRELEDLNKELNDIKSSEANVVVKTPEVNNVGGGLFSGDKLSGMLQVFGGNLMTKAAGMAAGFATELGDAVKQGIELAKQGEGIRIAFERLGRGDILQGLREATHGTVTDLELMKAAVKFNDFKLPLEELGTMLAFAQQKAKDTGQSVDYMVDSIVTGLGRKSLMILDNLGLSANEVKEKMKETGDMTKAVGEIIREQMAKAGEYVETAADRATKADVDLKNAMEDLGRTFQPLTDAGTSMWNSLKIGALDLLNNAVRPLIDALTEAGRIRKLYYAQKETNDTKIQEMFAGLSNSELPQHQHRVNLAYFDKNINKYQQYLTDYKKWQSDKTAIGAYDRMAAFQKQTGLSMYSDVKEQLEVFKKMRSEYVMGAKSIIADNPAPSPATPTEAKKGGSGKSTTPTAPTYAADSIAAQQALVSELTKQWNESGAEVRNSYIQPLVEAEAKLKTMKDQQALLKEQAQGRLLEDKAIEIPITANVSDSIVQSIDEIREQLRNNPIVIPVETTTKDVKAIQETAKTTAMVVGTIGQAFNAIEDPAAKVAGTVAQAIASVALGYAQATVNAASMGPWAWIAFAASGLATMMATITSIHSATGYAEGGMIKGNSYSGDNIGGLVDGSQFVGLNAGELVLNRAQQANLASDLTNGGARMIQVVGRLRGQDIFLSAENWSKSAGHGEFVTW